MSLHLPTRRALFMGGIAGLLQNLVAYWKLDESGGTRYDEVTPGIGPAAQFAKANTENLSINSNATLVTGDTDFTVAAWVYLDSKSSVMMILSKLPAAGDVEYELAYNNATDRLNMTYTNPGAVQVNADTLGSPSTGTWYFVVGWYDAAADTLNISVNNGAADSLADGGVKPRGDLTGPLKIGLRGGDNTFPFDGRIRSAALWKKVLTAAERTSLYNDGRGMAYRDLSGSLLTSLNAWWDLSEPAGTRYDSTANDNDLTDNNTVTQATGPAGGNSLGEANTVTQAAGKLGNAGQFTAANSEYLACPDNADLSMGDIDFTIAAWVYLDSKADNMAFVGKWNAAGTYEYAFNYGVGADRFQLNVSGDGTALTTVAADTLGSPSTAAWYFVVCWHDSVANTINIQVNDGTVDSAEHTTGGYDGATAFRIGAMASDTQYQNGRIDAVGIWKRVLTAAERTWLYNGGNGREYSW